MSRTYEALSEQNAVAVTAPSLPAEVATELDNFRLAAMDGMRASFLGTLLRFKKGTWLYGADGRELEPGTEAVALMGEFRRGWVRWEKSRATNHVVGKIAQGFVVPPRDSLGDTDQAHWPLGLSGKREDPWQLTLYAPLKSLDGEDIYTFATSSDGGNQAVYKLVERYAWLGRKHPGEFPIVTLDSETYEHPRFGTVHKPKLEIVGWTGRPAIELSDAGTEPKPGAEPSRKSDMDDEIPF
jgi:hypothetical protein